MKSPALTSYLDTLAQRLYGLTRTEAHERKICISCKSPIGPENIFTPAGATEYSISALCETCYDAAEGEEGGPSHV